MVSKIKYIFALFLLLPVFASAQLTVQQGGIGTSSVPRNYVVIGSSALRLTAVATSSLGLESPLTFSSPLSRTGNAVSFLFNTTNTWTGLNTFQLGFLSQASSTAIHLHLTGLATPSGAYLAVDPNGEIIATTTPSSGTGTVTSIATTFPIQGGPITTAGTLTFGGLSTSTTWTQGGVAVAGLNKNTLYTAPTTTLSGSGVITVTAGGSVLGASPITVACATCSTTLGTVTSITAGNGLNGGTITSAGTIDLKSYFATSSAEIAGNLAYWTSTSGTPATLGKVATTTVNVSPAFSTSTTLGYLVGGSSGLISSKTDPSITWYATSSTTFVGSEVISIQPKAVLPYSFSSVVCEARNGGSSGAGTFVSVQLGIGTASTTALIASSTINTFTFSSPFSIAVGSHVWIQFSTTSPITVNSGGLYVNCTFARTT